MTGQTPEPSRLRTVQEALIDVRKALGAVGKGDYNANGKYNFRGIDAIVNATAGPLLEAGVSIVPAEVKSIEQVDVKSGSKRTDMQASRIVIRFRVYGPAGDWFDVEGAGEAYDSGDKATPKASTVAWRTVLLQLLHIPTDDPDPDSMTYDRNDPAVHVPPEQTPKQRAWAATSGAGDQAQRVALLDARLGRLDPPAQRTQLADDAAEWIAVAADLELNGYDVQVSL